jgi:succinate dehydrogenase flavin-adding protein (antitoxin of CptAB toxin-antitoxin module)
MMRFLNEHLRHVYRKAHSEFDNLYFESKSCCYTGCLGKPIISHTIPENYLYKLNQPLTKVLTFQPRLGRIVKKFSPQHVIKIDKSRFSTFKGFCESHDNDLF